ncbi:cell division protein ZapA [Pusillimonas sp. MFBS29]|uniref:cell division protein ZapA n=1 Tax=Pusillimonas sp. MFBS29 TaxID=2886690 RepID=UPI001D102786|nr:cell division protein ZapA [Pusillimonas sp. MFBS29]MCC2596878.1 cell division protein ZapA [Pusillimonas sp. MFBS29]
MERVDVSILGRDYSLACQPAEKETLLAAVRHVDQRMLGVKGSGKVSSNERIAVMAAIQIAGELLSMRAPDGPLGNVAVGDFKRRMDDMNALLDQVVVPVVQEQS